MIHVIMFFPFLCVYDPSFSVCLIRWIEYFYLKMCLDDPWYNLLSFFLFLCSEILILFDKVNRIFLLKTVSRWPHVIMSFHFSCLYVPSFSFCLIRWIEYFYLKVCLDDPWYNLLSFFLSLCSELLILFDKVNRIILLKNVSRFRWFIRIFFPSEFLFLVALRSSWVGWK